MCCLYINDFELRCQNCKKGAIVKENYISFKTVVGQGKEDVSKKEMER